MQDHVSSPADDVGHDCNDDDEDESLSAVPNESALVRSRQRQIPPAWSENEQVDTQHMIDSTPSGYSCVPACCFGAVISNKT